MGKSRTIFLYARTRVLSFLYKLLSPAKAGDSGTAKHNPTCYHSHHPPFTSRVYGSLPWYPWRNHRSLKNDLPQHPQGTRGVRKIGPKNTDANKKRATKAKSPMGTGGVLQIGVTEPQSSPSRIPRVSRLEGLFLGIKGRQPAGRFCRIQFGGHPEYTHGKGCLGGGRKKFFPATLVPTQPHI